MTVDRHNTHVTDVTHGDRKVRVTTITTRALRPQWECYLTKQTRRVRRKWPWKWREPRSASMYSSPSRRCPSLILYPAHWTTTHPVWRQIIYDWRLLKLLAAVLDVWSCLMQPKCMLVASSSFSHLSVAGSGDVTRDKLTFSIGFHTRTLPALPPLVSVYRFPTICSEWVARRRHRLLSDEYWAWLLRKVLGQYQYHPILASIGQYPNTGIVRTLLAVMWNLCNLDLHGRWCMRQIKWMELSFWTLMTHIFRITILQITDVQTVSMVGIYLFNCHWIRYGLGVGNIA